MASTTGAPAYRTDGTYEVDTRDVVYRNDGARDWLATVYQPRGSVRFPALLSVHGGAWARFDRMQNSTSDYALAASGLVVVSIDFHSAHEGAYPAPVADINYAIRWVKANAASFGADATQLGGIGFSSGGHQVMLVAMRPSDPRYASLPLEASPDLSASLDYVIMCWPVIDPLSRYEQALAGRINPINGTPESIAAEHIAYFGNEATMREANPHLILERGESVQLPPVLIVQGAADEQLAPFMIEKFVHAYSDAGGVIELALYPGEPHSFMRTHPDAANSRLAIEAIKSFIARQLVAV